MTKKSVKKPIRKLVKKTAPARAAKIAKSAKPSAKSSAKPTQKHNAGAGAKVRSETVHFIGKSKATRFYLPNGLRLIVVPNHTAPVFSYQTWYKVGSRNEVVGLSGIAHLFEHMMFKETKNLKLGVFDKTMESLGAPDMNAFTGTDYTAYIQSLPIEALDKVAYLESERMTNLMLTKEQLEPEREVVQNERKQRTENNPEGLIFEELQKLAYTCHAYGRPVIGFEEDINRISTKDCEEFYNAYYAPNNAVIVIVGDVKPEKALKVIQKHYGHIPASQINASVIAAEPEQNSERRKELRLTIQLPKTYMAYKIPDASHPDQVPLALLSTILSTGRSSRLYRALVDKGITLDANTGPNPGIDPGLFYITFSSQSSHTPAEAIAIVDEVIRKIQAEGVTKEELQRAKNKSLTEFYMGLVTNPAKANFIGQGEVTYGDFSYSLHEMEQMHKATLEDIQRVAKQYLVPERRSMVIGVPNG
jgi:zinc protease